MRKLQLERKPIDFAVISYVINKLNADAWTVNEVIVSIAAIKNYIGASKSVHVKDSLKRLAHLGVLSLKPVTNSGSRAQILSVSWVANTHQNGKQTINNNNNTGGDQP